MRFLCPRNDNAKRSYTIRVATRGGPRLPGLLGLYIYAQCFEKVSAAVESRHGYFYSNGERESVVLYANGKPVYDQRCKSTFPRSETCDTPYRDFGHDERSKNSQEPRRIRLDCRLNQQQTRNSYLVDPSALRCFYQLRRCDVEHGEVYCTERWKLSGVVSL